MKQEAGLKTGKYLIHPKHIYQEMKRATGKLPMMEEGVTGFKL